MAKAKKFSELSIYNYMTISNHKFMIQNGQFLFCFLFNYLILYPILGFILPLKTSDI